MTEFCDFPLITIGITAYNARDSIENAIDSALSQSWPRKEIVVVDDASTDGTEAILVRMESKYPDLRVFFLKENKGVSAARNTIIGQARGEFLAFFDDDDTSDPCRIEKQYSRITDYEQATPGAGKIICYTARIQSYPDGAVHYEPTVGAGPDSPAPHGGAVARRILYGAPLEDAFGSMATCSQMARSATYRALGGFDEDFRRCEDTDFNIRCALSGGHFIGIAEPLVKQTMTYGSDKTIDDEERFYKMLIAKHASFIDGNGASSLFCDRWLRAKYIYLRGRRLEFCLSIAALFVRYPFLTFQRLLWALPNRKFLSHSRQFYKDFS